MNLMTVPALNDLLVDFFFVDIASMMHIKILSFLTFCVKKCEAWTDILAFNQTVILLVISLCLSVSEFILPYTPLY